MAPLDPGNPNSTGFSSIFPTIAPSPPDRLALPRAIFVPPTLWTVTQQFEPVGCREKSIPLADLILNPYDLIIRKFNDFPATNASEMAVLLVAVNVLVVKMTVLEVDLLDQSTLDKKGNRSVYRGLGNTSLSAPETQIKVIHIEMIMGRENLANNHLSLRCVPETSIFDKFPKSVDLVHGCVSLLRFNFNNTPFPKQCQA